LLKDTARTSGDEASLMTKVSFSLHLPEENYSFTSKRFLAFSN